MANKDKILNLPWQIGREFTVSMLAKNNAIIYKEFCETYII
jgi:hypothetical protein